MVSYLWILRYSASPRVCFCLINHQTPFFILFKEVRCDKLKVVFILCCINLVVRKVKSKQYFIVSKFYPHSTIVTSHKNLLKYILKSVGDKQHSYQRPLVVEKLSNIWLPILILDVVCKVAVIAVLLVGISLALAIVFGCRSYHTLAWSEKW